MGKSCGNGCKSTFTAKSPVSETAHTVDDSTDEEKAGRCDRNAMANATVAMLRYWYGVAHYRLAKIQGSIGMGLPVATQYKMAQQVFSAGLPVYEYLIEEAAQGALFFADDTGIKILDWLAGKGPPTKTTKTPRKSAKTTAVVSRSVEGRTIVLYLTGGSEAGDKMSDVLRQEILL